MPLNRFFAAPKNFTDRNDEHPRSNRSLSDVVMQMQNGWCALAPWGSRNVRWGTPVFLTTGLRQPNMESTSAREIRPNMMPYSQAHARLHTKYSHVPK
jgi:hypothetical protein